MASGKLNLKSWQLIFLWDWKPFTLNAFTQEIYFNSPASSMESCVPTVPGAQTSQRDPTQRWASTTTHRPEEWLALYSKQTPMRSLLNKSNLWNYAKNPSFLEVPPSEHSMCCCFQRHHAFHQSSHSCQDDGKCRDEKWYVRLFLPRNLRRPNGPESYSAQVSNEICYVAKKHFCHFLPVVANSTTMWVICGEEATGVSSVYCILINELHPQPLTREALSFPVRPKGYPKPHTIMLNHDPERVTRSDPALLPDASDTSPCSRPSSS